MAELNVSIDVLSYWYKSAKRAMERGEIRRSDGRYEDQYKESYEMAAKTVEQLKPLENMLTVNVVQEDEND